MTYERFHQIKKDLCLQFGGSVISGMRSLQRNKSVGGHAESRHLWDEAADIVLDDWALAPALAKEAKRRGLFAKVSNPKQSIHIQIPQG